MADRIPVQARAIVTSTRPGALSILEADDALEDGPVARYFAEPAKIAEAMALLEALGFSITARDRIGVSFSGWQETFETAFPVTLSRVTEDEVEVWQALPTGGGKPLVVIPPAGDAQRACLRGVLLDVPDTEYARAPINSPAWEKAELQARPNHDKYPYWIYPHQLRRQLSAPWRSDSELDKLPRGAGIRVAVVDSGWDPDHPYWAKVNLLEAAHNVRLVRDQGYAVARQSVVDHVGLMTKHLEQLAAKLDSEQARSTLRQRVMFHSEVRRSQILKLCNESQEHLDYAYRTTGNDDLKKARAELDKAGSDHGTLDRMVTTLVSKLREAVKIARDDLSGLPAETAPDATPPHGTSVVGQLIAVAPEADVTVVQRCTEDNFAEGFTKRHTYRGLDNLQALRVAATLKPRPNIISYSLGHAFNFNPAVIDKDHKKARKNMKNEYAAVLEKMDTRGIAGFFCSGNYYAKKGEPPKVVAHSQLTTRNLILVGGAWWDKPGSGPGDKRTLSASDYAIGYLVSQTNIRVPHVCGLVGPAPVPPETKSDEHGWGMCIAPVKGYGRYWYYASSGTSLSTPQVAGVGAAVLSVQPKLGPRGLRSLLMETSVRIPKGKFRMPGWAKSVLSLKVSADRPGLADLYAATTTVPSGFAEIDFVEALSNANWKTANLVRTGTKWKVARE